MHHALDRKVGQRDYVLTNNVRESSGVQALHQEEEASRMDGILPVDAREVSGWDLASGSCQCR